MSVGIITTPPWEMVVVPSESQWALLRSSVLPAPSINMFPLLLKPGLKAVLVRIATAPPFSTDRLAPGSLVRIGAVSVLPAPVTVNVPLLSSQALTADAVAPFCTVIVP